MRNASSPQIRFPAVAVAVIVLAFSAVVAGGGPALAGSAPSKAQWLSDVSSAMSGGDGYLDSEQDRASKPAIVLDIDNTALETYYDFGAPTPPVLAFEQHAISDGYSILFVTGRTGSSSSTVTSLQNAGYRVDQICMRPSSSESVGTSKKNCRAKLAGEGYSILANVGNNSWDFTGGNDGREFVLPNYDGALS